MWGSQMKRERSKEEEEGLAAWLSEKMVKLPERAVGWECLASG